MQPTLDFPHVFQKDGAIRSDDRERTTILAANRSQKHLHTLNRERNSEKPSYGPVFNRNWDSFVDGFQKYHHSDLNFSTNNTGITYGIVCQGDSNGQKFEVQPSCIHKFPKINRNNKRNGQNYDLLDFGAVHLASSNIFPKRASSQVDKASLTASKINEPSRAKNQCRKRRQSQKKTDHPQKPLINKRSMTGVLGVFGRSDLGISTMNIRCEGLDKNNNADEVSKGIIKDNTEDKRPLRNAKSPNGSATLQKPLKDLKKALSPKTVSATEGASQGDNGNDQLDEDLTDKQLDLNEKRAEESAKGVTQDRKSSLKLPSLNMNTEEKTPELSETSIESIKDVVPTHSNQTQRLSRPVQEAVTAASGDQDESSDRGSVSKSKQDWSQRKTEEMERSNTNSQRLSFPAAVRVVTNLLRSQADARKRESERSEEMRKSASDQSTKHKKNKAGPSKGDGVIKIMTDDADVPRYVSNKRDLPLYRYSSLGLILDNKGFAKTPVAVSEQLKTRMSGRPVLTPVPPEKETGLGYETGSDRHHTNKHDAPVIFDDMMPKRGPLVMATAPQAGRAPPPFHEGVVWPLAWAKKPPYAAPGYNRSGAKQPIGTVQVAPVPAKPSKAVINGKKLMLPTWISPLYKSYGIGGPFGPNGPFYEPQFLSDDAPPMLPEKPPRQLCFLSRWARRLWDDQNKKDKNNEEKVRTVEAQLAQIKQIINQESYHTEKVSHVEQNLADLLKDINNPAPKLLS